MTDGMTNEEAQKIKIEQLTEQLQASTDALAKAVKQIDSINENEKTRLIKEISDRSSFKEGDLTEKSVDTLRTISLSLDAAGVTVKGVGVGKSYSADSRRRTTGLTMGRWNPQTKQYEGGI